MFRQEIEEMIVQMGDEETITYCIQLEVIKRYIVCEGGCQSHCDRVKHHTMVIGSRGDVLAMDAHTMEKYFQI